MLKLTAITLMIVGVLTYVGFYSYNKLMTVSLASNVNNFYQGSPNGEKSQTMTLSDCSPGSVPFLPSFQGKIVMQPQSVNIPQKSKVMVINGDTVAHTIGIINTKYWEAINPGASIEIDTKDLDQTEKWLITCDGINLGNNSPSISVDTGI